MKIAGLFLALLALACPTFALAKTVKPRPKPQYDIPLPFYFIKPVQPKKPVTAQEWESFHRGIA